MTEEADMTEATIQSALAIVETAAGFRAADAGDGATACRCFSRAAIHAAQTLTLAAKHGHASAVDWLTNQLPPSPGEEP